MNLVNYPCKESGWKWLIALLKWLLIMIYDKWRRTQRGRAVTGQRQLHFGYNSCFGTSWLYHFLRRVDPMKFPQKFGQEISSIQLGSNAWSAHCSALDNMTMNKLQINRFEVEVESVLFPDFFCWQDLVWTKNMTEINLLAFLWAIHSKQSLHLSDSPGVHFFVCFFLSSLSMFQSWLLVSRES